jgi:hypothetical protein
VLHGVIQQPEVLGRHFHEARLILEFELQHAVHVTIARLGVFDETQSS